MDSTPFFKYLWAGFFSLQALIILSCNVISLVIFVRKYRHLKTNILLINLSIADIMTGLFGVKMAIFPVELLTSSSDPSCRGTFLSNLLKILNQGSLESTATLALIAVERAYAVIKPLQHRVLKRRYYRCGVILTWCLTAIPNITTLAMSCQTDRIKVPFILSYVVIVCSIVVMLVSYVAIYIKLRFFPVFQHNANTHMQMRLLKTLLITTVASVGTMVPFGGYRVYDMFCYMTCFRNNTFSAVLLLIAQSNSFINFFIYAWKMPEFGREVAKMICIFRAKTTPLNEEQQESQPTTTEGGMASKNAGQVETSL